MISSKRQRRQPAADAVRISLGAKRSAPVSWTVLGSGFRAPEQCLQPIKRSNVIESHLPHVVQVNPYRLQRRSDSQNIGRK